MPRWIPRLLRTLRRGEESNRVLVVSVSGDPSTACPVYNEGGLLLGSETRPGAEKLTLARSRCKGNASKVVWWGSWGVPGTHRRRLHRPFTFWHEAGEGSEVGGPWLTSGRGISGWGLGCKDCAVYLATGKSCKDARFSKFANFEVRPTTRYGAKWLIEQHNETQSHRVASGMQRARPQRAAKPPQPQPLACPIALAAKSLQLGGLSEEDAILFKGNAPSQADWREAWTKFSETMSLRKAARLRAKAQPGSCIEAQQRKRYRKQQRVMAEVLRNKMRNVLRQATAICLSLDECKGRKIIRFRADLPSAWCAQPGSDWCVGASGFSQAGVLGVIDVAKEVVTDFEDDNAVVALKRFEEFLTVFCTSLGRRPGSKEPQLLACDEDLKKHIIKSVLVVAADGDSGGRRVLFLAARELFPNLLLCIRDSAHAIRLAAKALHSDEVFGEVWQELFHKEHALVPDLMNSKKWHDLLVAVQKSTHTAVKSGQVIEPLAGVITNIAFAKQRFDSAAGPVAKMALMFLPAATLLAYMASDLRCDKETRDRALELLKKMDTKFCTATGVSADWGIICAWFLRRFDVAYHDIAMSRCEIDGMIETLDAVFLQGRVFQRVLATQTPSPLGETRCFPSDPNEESLPRISANGGNCSFITPLVMRTLSKKYVFFAAGCPVLLWNTPPSKFLGELQQRLENVATMTKERLLADFPRNDVRSALAVFDRRTVIKGFGPLPSLETRRTLLQGVRQLARLLGLEEIAAELQYTDVLNYMIKNWAPNQPLAGKTNQEAWALLLNDGVWEAACPSTVPAACRVLRRIIRFYISIEDGECTVERDLGVFRDKKLEHRTDDMKLLDDVLVIALNGPRTAAEFADGTEDSPVELTEFTRQCASLWRELYGLRFGHYNPKATAAARLAKLKNPGEFTACSRGVLNAARIAVQDARRKRRKAELHSGAGTADSAHWNEKMTKWRETTKHNIPGVTQVREEPGSHFIDPPKCSLAAKRAARAPPEGPTLYHKVALLGASTQPLAGLLMHCQVLKGRHRCAEADIVVVPDLGFLHDENALAGDVDLAVSFLYVVALGLNITTQANLAAESVQHTLRRLTPEHCVRHTPIITQQPYNKTFVLGPALDDDVESALKRLTRTEGSRFSLSKKRKDDDIFFGTVRDVMAWACSVRRVAVERGPKAVTVDGQRLPA